MADLVQGICGSSPAPPTPTSGSHVTPVSERAANVTSGAPPQLISDATDLSSLGDFVKSVVLAAQAQNSVRPDLVASLKSQIATGTYHPEPDAVAAQVAAALRV